jgi:4-hydroxythreonine-4-phosphate dehydrogenase
MIDMITKERVYNTIKQAEEGCRQLGITNPKIGVCGLNPHASEGGIMGHEEEAEIIPAIEQARAEGLYIEGPYPADTVYPRGTAGTLDIIVAMYHDQGHIPVKLMGFQFDGKTWHSVSGVNITIGLPIIRVSVDHGTAFGKAGKGIANETSILDAIEYANLIAVNRKFV